MQLTIRVARIWTGLIMLAFVTSHLLNLSMGLISVEAMDVARPYLTGFWTGRVLGTVLLVSLIVHFGLGLWFIYKRPTLRTNTHDLVQLYTGVLVVPLLATHAVGISMVQRYGVEFGYAEAIRLFWLQTPAIGLLQVIVLAVVWVHGCAGLFTWLRSKKGALGLLPWLYPVAVAVPIIALLGYAEAGRAMVGGAIPQPPAATPQGVPYAFIKELTTQIILWSALIALGTFAARAIRLALQSTTSVLISRDGVVVPSTSDMTLLDGFQKAHEPHAHLCAGRGRCGTCAVRVVASEFPLPLATPLEQRTLMRTGAPEGARLACQLKPTGGRVEVEALYPADYSFDDHEDEIAVAEVAP